MAKASKKKENDRDEQVAETPGVGSSTGGTVDRRDVVSEQPRMARQMRDSREGEESTDVGPFVGVGSEKEVKDPAAEIEPDEDSDGLAA